MEQECKRLVFVYGSLLEGRGNHYIIGDNPDSTLVSRHTTEPAYTMWSVGAYPAVCSGGETAIKGEVWAVPEKVWQQIEWLEGYPDYYGRLSLETPSGEAVMYVWDGDRESTSGLEQVESGDWNQFLDNWMVNNPRRINNL